MNRKKWDVLDVWAWPYDRGVADSEVRAWVRDRRKAFPGAEVRTTTRRVRAFGAAKVVTVGVVRREVTA